MLNFVTAINIFLVSGSIFFTPDPIIASGMLEDTRNIVSDHIIISEILITGNKITKEHIILRELTFSKGDTLDTCVISDMLIRSRQNLLNTSLFNYVTIDTVSMSPDKTGIKITVEERWYLWPYLILDHADRNFSAFIHDKDWNRINYGIYFIKYNFRGRNETLKFKLRLGYKEQYAILYDNPNIDKKQKCGLEAGISYYRQKEIPYTTNNNELVYYKESDRYVRETISSSVSYSYRQKLYDRHNLVIGYLRSTIADSVAELNSEYFCNGSRDMNYFSVSYGYIRDMRDSKVYPLKGYCFKSGIVKYGLGFEKGQSINNFYYVGSFAHHIPVVKRIYFTSGVKARKSFISDNPYYLNSAMGYSDYLRGYEYYVIDGQDYYINRNVVKYELLPTKIKRINIIPFSKFNKVHYAIYLNLFFETGYVVDKFASDQDNNELANKFLYSGGMGIDLVTYYDNVFRIEYSVNGLGESGFFIHYGASLLNF